MAKNKNRYEVGSGLSNRSLFLIIIVIAALVLAAGAFFFWPKTPSPVPVNVQRAVSFPIYYPDQEKLPTGYTLNKNSFSTPRSNGVAYYVSYGQNKRIVFSAQKKPSDSEMNLFYKSYIPLRSEFKTPVGKAEIGAYDNQGKVTTLVSLPVDNTNTWLVITAPSDIDQNKLKQVLSALRR